MNHGPNDADGMVLDSCFAFTNCWVLFWNRLFLHMSI